MTVFLKDLSTATL